MDFQIEIPTRQEYIERYLEEQEWETAGTHHWWTRASPEKKQAAAEEWVDENHPHAER